MIDNPSPLDKCLAIYKGDVLAGTFYIFVGVIFLISSVIIYSLAHYQGYYYLSIAMLPFGLYGLIKGFMVVYIYQGRLNFYKKHVQLKPEGIQEETEYTRFRLEKKARNRRAYIYATIIASVLATTAVFTPYKSLITATMIPVALFSGIEFCIGLLTEFRLWEYIRQLEKIK